MGHKLLIHLQWDMQHLLQLECPAFFKYIQWFLIFVYTRKYERHMIYVLKCAQTSWSHSYNLLPYITVYRSHSSLPLQNLISFTNIFIFKPLNPSFQVNKIWIISPLHDQHAHMLGSLYLLFGSKVMADCCVTHHTPPCFFDGLMYLNCIFCTAKMMFPSLPSPGRVVPIVGNVETENGCTCGKLCFGYENLLLLMRPAHRYGVLLHLRRMVAPDLRSFGVAYTP